MSTENHRAEAARWFEQAADDLEAARVLHAGSHFAQACFYSQQAAEKALKALGWAHGEDLWGHSLIGLCKRLRNLGVSVSLRDADLGALDRLYIPSRYPSGLPDLAPKQAFFDPDSREAMERAAGVIEFVRQALGASNEGHSS